MPLRDDTQTKENKNKNGNFQQDKPNGIKKYNFQIIFSYIEQRIFSSNVFIKTKRINLWKHKLTPRLENVLNGIPNAMASREKKTN